jgi:hypothetical protein
VVDSFALATRENRWCSTRPNRDEPAIFRVPLGLVWRVTGAILQSKAGRGLRCPQRFPEASLGLQGHRLARGEPRKAKHHSLIIASRSETSRAAVYPAANSLFRWGNEERTGLPLSKSGSCVLWTSTINYHYPPPYYTTSIFSLFLGSLQFPSVILCCAVFLNHGWPVNFQARFDFLYRLKSRLDCLSRNFSPPNRHDQAVMDTETWGVVFPH